VASPTVSRLATRLFRDLIDRCLERTGEPQVAAVKRFLDDKPLGQLDLDDSFDPRATITFRVDGRFPVELPSVQSFWAEENDPALKGARVMQCLVCGQERPILDRLEEKVKGVPGGQPSGTSIISANKEAFESYGLEASLIAPTCAECGERFTKAANELLASEDSCVRMGGAAFIFWTREDAGFDFRGAMIQANPEQVQNLIESVRSGRRAAGVDDTRFFATVLSGSGGRAVVRDWIDTTVGEVKENVVRWFAGQEIVDAYGQTPRPLGLQALAFATVREPRDLPPPTLRMLVRSALKGEPVPPGLLHRAVLRNRAERQVTRQRAALIKLTLLTQEPELKEGYMVQLDSDTLNPAYRCGRLLAVLEQAQRLAIPGIKATIVDRFFGTASSTPVAVFGRLIRGAQPHLAKLERDRPGAYYALSRRLEEIQGGLPLKKVGSKEFAYPRVLTLEEQGLFALGYYHQRAFDRAQAMEARARRDAGQAAGNEADLLEEEGEEN
jgi:CRISPR-associated protein Csd1